MGPRYRTVIFLLLLACLLVFGLLISPPAALYESFAWGLLMLGGMGAGKSAVQHVAQSKIFEKKNDKP